MMINSKTKYISANFSPNKAWHMFGTNLEVKHRPTQKIPSGHVFPPVATFMGVFGEPWKSKKLRW